MIVQCLPMWVLPAICPPQSWQEPAASWISPLMTKRMALEVILLTTSQMPIGRTPGRLSRAINQQAKKGANVDGCTYWVHSRRARRAREWHNSSEASLNVQQSLLQPCASRPDGPAAPLVCLAAWRIRSASMHSKITGSGRGGSSSGKERAS